MVNNKWAGLVMVETPGLVPTQFRPHRTLGLFQIDANMVWAAAIDSNEDYWYHRSTECSLCERREDGKKTCLCLCKCGRAHAWVRSYVTVCLCMLMLSNVCVHRVRIFACGCVWYFSMLAFISVCVSPFPSCWCHQYTRCDWWQSLPQSAALLLNVLFVY